MQLIEALAELDAALDDTRAARVAALSDGPILPAHLIAVLGEVPNNTAGRQAWRGLASRIESYRDRHPEALGHEGDGGVMAAIGPRQAERWLPDPEWDDLASQLRHGPALVAVAAEIEGRTSVSPVGAETLSWAYIPIRLGRCWRRNGERLSEGSTGAWAWACRRHFPGRGRHLLHPALSPHTVNASIQRTATAR